MYAPAQRRCSSPGRSRPASDNGSGVTRIHQILAFYATRRALTGESHVYRLQAQSGRSDRPVCSGRGEPIAGSEHSEVEPNCYSSAAQSPVR